MNFLRNLARRLVDHARWIMPRPRRDFGDGMRQELEHLGDDREALGFAAGCVGAGYRERLGAAGPHWFVLRWSMVVVFLMLSLLGVTLTLSMVMMRMTDIATIRTWPGMDSEALLMVELYRLLPAWEVFLMPVWALILAFGVLRLMMRRPDALKPIAVALVGHTLHWLIDLRFDPMREAVLAGPFLETILVPLVGIALVAPAWMIARRDRHDLATT